MDVLICLSCDSKSCQLLLDSHPRLNTLTRVEQHFHLHSPSVASLLKTGNFFVRVVL